MAIVSTDLVLYGATNKPESDSTASGGTVTTTFRPEMTAMSSNAVITINSTTEDTRNVTITGRNAAGAVVSEIVTLTGTTVATGLLTFERLHKVTAASTHATAVINVYQGVGGITLSTIPAMELGFYSLFQLSSSSTGTVTRYEKIYWKNTHATLTLTNAKVVLTADPSSRIRIGLDTSKDAVTSVVNRITAPAGVSFSDDSVEIDVPGNTLEAGSVIGVWVEQALQASDTPFKSSFTTKLQGSSV